MWETKQLKIKKDIVYKNEKLKTFKFETQHTKTFKNNRNFLAKVYFYILL